MAFEYFKKFKGLALVFGFDWMGRQFALNESSNKSVILMLDPATAEAFEKNLLLEQSLDGLRDPGREPASRNHAYRA